MLNAAIFGAAAIGGLRPAMTLYAPDGSTVLGQVVADPVGVGALRGQTLPDDGDYYLAMTSEGNLDPLNPVQGSSMGDYGLTVANEVN